jgi:hypothetical protein
VTLSEILSLALLPLSAACCVWKTPTIALVLLVDFIVNLAYLRGIFGGEWVRWISALMGLAGAIEFGKGVERTKRRVPVSIPDALRKVDVATWIGLALLASMGVDGFGMIVFRLTDMWIVPETTIGILLLVAGLGLLGRRSRDESELESGCLGRRAVDRGHR